MARINLHVSDEVRQLVEKHWPWLLSKLLPQNEK
jgi:hypothetical protein